MGLIFCPFAQGSIFPELGQCWRIIVLFLRCARRVEPDRLERIETGILIIAQRAVSSSRFVLAGDWQEHRSYRLLLNHHLNGGKCGLNADLGEGTAAMDMPRASAFDHDDTL